MDDLDSMIREYDQILGVERDLERRKQELRTCILERLRAGGMKTAKTGSGTAERRVRFTLRAKRAEVLELLPAGDLFPFAQFTPAKVRDLLVPKYGRELLLPLFDCEKTEYLQVRRIPQHANGRLHELPR